MLKDLLHVMPTPVSIGKIFNGNIPNSIRLQTAVVKIH